MNIKDFELFLQIHDHVTEQNFDNIKRIFRASLEANRPDGAQIFIDELIKQNPNRGACNGR